MKHLSTSFNKFNSKKHKLAVNEGSAVAMGIGHYLETKKIPCVYMQNSGLGNALSPLTSLVDEEVYSIPMLILVGNPAYGAEPYRACSSKNFLESSIIKEITELE